MRMRESWTGSGRATNQQMHVRRMRVCKETNRLDTTLRCFLSGAEFIFIVFIGHLILQN
jgi:hypothetical protein